MSLSIIGTGSALPARRVTNDDLAKTMDTSDEWIRSRTGIAERRLCEGEESAYTLGVTAAQKAIEDAGIAPSDISLVIVSSVAPDEIVPPLACRIMGAVGAQCPAFDINAACSGFLYALKIASGIAGGPVLIVCAEQTSRYMDFGDRRVSILFGDGAGAAVVAPGPGTLHMQIRAIHDEGRSLVTKGVNHRDEEGKLAPSYLQMDGQEVFKFAAREMIALLRDAFAATGLTQRDFAAIIPHQANARIIKSCSERLGIPMERFLMHIERYGNTSSASIPIALDEARKQGALKKGERVLLVGFGAGWTSGAAAIEL